MIRLRSKEKFGRLAVLVAGDFLLAWGTLALAVYIRRTVPLVFTRSLLPTENITLDGTTVVLFAVSFLAALALSGFYRRRILPRERPLILTALVIQVALIAIGGAFNERALPRTVIVGVILM
ncbi:MAG: hypothetical protein QOC81_3149, partial [Thermoanaerobaculia bacterium]|nr:hypothetical protein [Thermoanaerobaculia bacterium]